MAMNKWIRLLQVIDIAYGFNLTDLKNIFYIAQTLTPLEREQFRWNGSGIESPSLFIRIEELEDMGAVVIKNNVVRLTERGKELLRLRTPLDKTTWELIREIRNTWKPLEAEIGAMLLYLYRCRNDWQKTLNEAIEVRADVGIRFIENTLDRIRDIYDRFYVYDKKEDEL